MSYILDALKRAEAERTATAAARAALPASFVTVVPTRPALRALRWLGPLVAALAIGVFLLEQRTEPPPAVAVKAVQAATAPGPGPGPAPEPAATAVPQAAAAIIIPPPAPLKPAPAPVSKPVARKAPSIGTLRDLPESIQREIPPLAVGGYLYAARAEDRTVLINKRLHREGDAIAPGLVLERLTPNGMVLSYRGHRFRSGY